MSFELSWDGKGILLFTSQHCVPCAIMKLMLAPLWEDESIAFEALECEENPEIVDFYDVKAVPTLLLMDCTGREIRRLVGMQPKKAIEDMFAELTE